MAAKVKIKTDGVEIAIKQAFDAVLKSNQMKTEVAEFSVNRIRNFARSSKSIVSGDVKKFKKLSESYRLMRFGLIKFRTINGKVIPMNTPDERLKFVDKQFFDPTLIHSNLTFTGQLLRSLKYTILKNGRINIFASGNRKDGQSNKKIAEYVAKNGRPFFGMDDKGKLRINNIVKRFLRRSLRVRNLTK